MSICKDHEQKWSMMRVGFLVTLVIGSTMCLAAIPAVYLDLPGANDLILGGSGMISATGFAKSIQARWEKMHAFRVE